MTIHQSTMAGMREERRSRDRELRRQDFLAAAERVFSRRGYHDAGMEEIAEEAGYAIGTVYRYFTSKKELYHTLLETKAMEQQQRLQGFLSMPGPVIERIRLLVRDELDFVRTHQEFLRVMVVEVMTNASDLNEGCRQLRADHRRNFHRLIEEGQRSGEFRPVDEELASVLISRMGETLFHETLGVMPAGPAFDRKLAKVEAFMLEMIDRTLLP